MKLDEAEIFNYYYYYHHENGKEYFIGQFFAIKAYNWESAKVYKELPAERKISDKLVELMVDESKPNVPLFLEQVSSAYDYCNLYYKRIVGKTNILVHVPSKITVSGLTFKCIDGADVTRHFANPFALAALLGAMINCGYNDFGYRGFSDITGTGTPSKNHNNGYYLDMGFLRLSKDVGQMHLTKPSATIGIANFDDKRQWNFFKELHRFKFTRHLVYTNDADRSKVDKSAETGESVGGFRVAFWSLSPPAY